MPNAMSILHEEIAKAPSTPGVPPAAGWYDYVCPIMRSDGFDKRCGALAIA
jgi:hypothetical protein